MGTKGRQYIYNSRGKEDNLPLICCSNCTAKTGFVGTRGRQCKEKEFREGWQSIDLNISLNNLYQVYCLLLRLVFRGRDDNPLYSVGINICTDQAGVVGTRGRQCNKKSRGRDGCRFLCCGRGFHTEVRIEYERCRSVLYIHIIILDIFCIYVLKICKQRS